MVDSDIEIFGDIWSALYALYDVDITPGMIQKSFDELSDVQLSSLQHAIKLYLFSAAYNELPTIEKLRELINVKS